MDPAKIDGVVNIDKTFVNLNFILFMFPSGQNIELGTFIKVVCSWVFAGSPFSGLV